MTSNSYYVYALKDPRNLSAQPFYVGKGTGTRAWDHLISPDQTSKGKRIIDIKNDGQDVLVSVLADELTEIQALKLEAELISAFGTVTTGGLLLNAVIPTGKEPKLRKDLVTPRASEKKRNWELASLKRRS